MAIHTTSGHTTYQREQPATHALKTPARQAYEVLHWTFVAIPVFVGIDKFLHLMTNWEAYFAPQLAKLSPVSVHATTRVTGVVEVIAGLIVAVRPKIGAWIVAAWLAGIVFDLALLGDNWDIAFRDVGLMLGAIALARLAAAHDNHDIP